MIARYKNRGSEVIVDEDIVRINRSGGRKERFLIGDVVEVWDKRCIYDIPFFERSVFVTLINGRRVKVKRMKKKNAYEFIDILEK